MRGEPRAVVDRVPVEGGELAEAGPHAALRGVESGVVLTRGLGKMRGVGGELVPEAVEVDALAARDEALHVGAAEPEMPEQRVFQDLVPGPDTRHRRVHQHQLRHPVRISRGQRVGDHVADVAGHHIGARCPQRIHHADDVRRLVGLLESGFRNGRKAEAAQIGDDHRVMLRKIGGKRHPHVAGVAIAVQQNDRWPSAADSDMEGGAVGCDLLSAEAGREVEAIGGAGGRAHQHRQRCAGECEPAKEGGMFIGCLQLMPLHGAKIATSCRPE